MAKKIKVGKFSLNMTDEVITKVTREVLSLFGIAVAERGESVDFAELSVAHEIAAREPRVAIKTTVTLKHLDGTEQRSETTGYARDGEADRAAIHRLVKLNFYRLAREMLSLPPAPWGILHGVRPSKIVHRYIDDGMNREDIISRLADDYDVGCEKAELLTDIAFYERPFLSETDERTVSVYVGIPFCLTRCLYCSFPSVILPSDDVLDEFMRTFEMDMRTAAQSIREHGFKVQSIYVGGGTPTSLPERYFARMMDLVTESFYQTSLGGKKGTVEFTVEAGRPDSITKEKLRTMAAHRVTRVSVNPQTMRDSTLRRIGRAHTAADIVKMYHEVRETGIPSINMDLIIGLPGEDERDVAYTMSEIKKLAPDDVTLHALALKRGSDLKTNLMLGAMENNLPDDDTARRMYSVAMDGIHDMGLTPYYLYRQGYQSGQLENIGCAKRGHESMYNIQIMEERQTIIGVGGAATTKVVNPATGRLKATFNPKDLKTYLEKISLYIDKRKNLIDESYGFVK